MTGRRLGLCAGSNVPGFMSAEGLPRGGRGFGAGRGFGGRGGRGFGQGFGMGRGFGHGYGWQYAVADVPLETGTPREQTAMGEEIAGLKSQLASLEAKLGKLLDKE